MKSMFKVLCALMTVLCLLMTSALAEPRYPDYQGQTTDAAAVLSRATLEDLAAYDEELSDEADINLVVATVDFLDGVTLDQYAAGLREKWDLDDDTLLLLMAVGEDKFGTYGGEDVNEHLSASVQKKLLSAYLEGPFLRQDYDGALQSYIPALTEEINKAFDADVSVKGLFGTNASSGNTTSQEWAEEWADEWVQRLNGSRTEHEEASSVRSRVTEEDESTGFSLGKVILTIFLLMAIFGDKGKRGSRRGCGCGCAPFSSLLAGLGLWKLWEPDFRRSFRRRW